TSPSAGSCGGVRRWPVDATSVVPGGGIMSTTSPKSPPSQQGPGTATRASTGDGDVEHAGAKGAAVSLRHVTVSFDDPATGAPHRVLDDLTLSSPPGEFLVLVGRSGCGKTTVLNVLSGLIDDVEGE